MNIVLGATNTDGLFDVVGITWRKALQRLSGFGGVLDVFLGSCDMARV